MMEAVSTSETSVDNYFTRQYIPEDNYEHQNDDYTNNSMRKSPSGEANSCSDSHEHTRILRNPNVHCRFHKRLLSVPVLSQMNTVHTTIAYLFKIYFNIIIWSWVARSV
jgi:hypothetical protein